MGTDSRQAYARGNVAAALAPHDVDRAIALIEPIKAEGDRDRYFAFIANAIAPGDPADKVRRHQCKTFDVRLAAGKTYQFDLMSRQFDAFLRIEDAAGAQIAFDDDGGDGLNSRIVLRIGKEGIYRVICTTFAGGQGAFTLQVRER